MKRILTLFILLCLIGCSTNDVPQQEITKPAEFNTVDNLITLKSEDVTINTDEDFNIDDYIKKTEGTTVMSSLDKDKKILSITAINGTNKQELNVPVKLESIYPITCTNVIPYNSSQNGSVEHTFIDKDTFALRSGEMSRTFKYYIKGNKMYFIHPEGDFISGILIKERRRILGVNNKGEPTSEEYGYSQCDKELPW